MANQENTNTENNTNSNSDEQNNRYADWLNYCGLGLVVVAILITISVSCWYFFNNDGGVKPITIQLEFSTNPNFNKDINVVVSPDLNAFQNLKKLNGKSKIESININFNPDLDSIKYIIDGHYPIEQIIDGLHQAEDSLRILLNSHENEIMKEVRSVTETEFSNNKLFSFALTIVSTLLSILAFFGFKNFQSIEEKAKEHIKILDQDVDKKVQTILNNTVEKSFDKKINKSFDEKSDDLAQKTKNLVYEELKAGVEHDVDEKIESVKSHAETVAKNSRDIELLFRMVNELKSGQDALESTEQPQPPTPDSGGTGEQQPSAPGSGGTGEQQPPTPGSGDSGEPQPPTPGSSDAEAPQPRTQTNPGTRKSPFSKKTKS